MKRSDQALKYNDMSTDSPMTIQWPNYDLFIPVAGQLFSVSEWRKGEKAKKLDLCQKDLTDLEARMSPVSLEKPLLYIPVEIQQLERQ